MRRRCELCACQRCTPAPTARTAAAGSGVRSGAGVAWVRVPWLDADWGWPESRWRMHERRACVLLLLLEHCGLAAQIWVLLINSGGGALQGSYVWAAGLTWDAGFAFGGIDMAITQRCCGCLYDIACLLAGHRLAADACLPCASFCCSTNLCVLLPGPGPGANAAASGSVFAANVADTWLYFRSCVVQALGSVFAAI